MDESRELLGLVSEQGLESWQDKGRSVRGKERQVASGDDLSMHSTGNPISQENPGHCGCQSTSFETDQLGLGAQGGQAAVNCTHDSPPQSRNLGVRDESQTYGDPTEDELVSINGAALDFSRMCRLINSAGLGDVLTERQLYELRKQFPEIQESRGRIRLLKFVAAICKKRKRAQPSNGRLQLADLYELLERQQYRCALTGEPLTPDDVALDHIVPISDGGDFAMENSQLVSKAANRAKNTMPQQEFVEMCIRVAQTHTGNGEGS